MALSHDTTTDYIGRDAEISLWNDVKAGDREAFALLYDRYVNFLFGYGKTLCPSDFLVEDSIHDVFVDLWKYRKNLSIDRSMKSYMFMCMRRKILSKIKEGKNFLNEDSAYLTLDYVESYQDTLIARQASTERKTRLDSMVSVLPKRQREAVYLKFYKNLSGKEISEVMNISVEVVYNLVSKALSRLRKQV